MVGHYVDCIKKASVSSKDALPCNTATRTCLFFHMHSFCFRDCSSRLHAILGSCDPSQTKNDCCCLLSFTCLRYQSENGSRMQRVPFVIKCMVCSTKQHQQAPLCPMNPCSQPGCSRCKRHAGDSRLLHAGPLQLKQGFLGSRLSSKVPSVWLPLLPLLPT